MDACAGRILEALEALGLAQDTLVLYTTDHGEMGYEHGLRGKFNFFEASARLPLLARLPGVIPAGAASQRPGRPGRLRAHPAGALRRAPRAP